MIDLDANDESAVDAGGEACADEEMAWAIPEYDRKRVNRAGRALVRAMQADYHEWSAEQWEVWLEELTVINNWRSAHGSPLNAFQTTLRTSARKFDPEALRVSSGSLIL